MRNCLFLVLLLAATRARGQSQKPEDFGYRHLQTFYKGDTVHVLVWSRSGEEGRPKPLFLFAQGSLPNPLLITDSLGAYGLFPFKSDSLLRDYHLAIIGKPFVPVVARKESLKPGNWYADPATGQAPEDYLRRDYVGYYVNRNLATIRFLRAQPWVSKEKLVLAGHSAGAMVMTRLAARSKDATHLILSSGNPMGRIVSIIWLKRAADSTGAATEETFRYWEGVVAQPDSTAAPGGGDPNKTTFDFSQPVVEDIKKLRIPVLVTYGTRDHCAPYNDYLRVELIREKKKHVQFKAYPGLEHNYFGFKPDGTVDYDNFNWDRVAADWWGWLRSQ